MSDHHYQDATPEAKLNIATYFIMNSPIGEVHDVVTDVTKLLNDPKTLNEANITKILSEYNKEQLISVSDNDGSPLLVTSFGQVDPTSYVDPNTGRVFKFDHRKQKFLEYTDKKQSVDDKYRVATAKALDNYLDQSYTKGKVVGLVYANDNGQLTVCISAKNVNISNFWTGSWRSVYILPTDRKSNGVEMKGTIKTNVHYFEDGNVQLHSNLDKQAKVNIGDPESTAQDIIKAVSKLEADFQAALEEMYVNMHHTTFKSMRRFYPVTREKMNWNLNAHSLANEVTNANASSRQG